MSHLFICYSRVDKPMAERLTQLLRKSYDHVWFDENLHGGEEWWAEILRVIGGCQHFIFLMSDDSVQSDWCRRELEEAFRLKKHVLPVLVRARTKIPDDLERIQRIDMASGITVEALNQLYATLIRYDPRVTQTGILGINSDRRLLERLGPFISGGYVEILSGEIQSGKIEWERYTSHITKYLDLRSKPQSHFLNPTLEEVFEAFDDTLIRLDGQIGWTYEAREIEGRQVMATPKRALQETYWVDKYNKLLKHTIEVWLQHVEVVKTVRLIVPDFNWQREY